MSKYFYLVSIDEEHPSGVAQDVGIFDTKEKAEAACRFEYHRVTKLKLNEDLGDIPFEVSEDTAYYPISPEEAERRRFEKHFNEFLEESGLGQYRAKIEPVEAL